MKYKRIILFFSVALPLSVIMRTLQLMNTIDTKTGFFLQEYTGIGYNLLFVIAAFCIVCGVLAFTCHRNPSGPPKTNIYMAVSSVLLAVALACELFTEKFTATVRFWQIGLLMLCGLASIAYFIIFAVNAVYEIKYPKLLSVAPALYFILRIICTFTSISSLALISDNLILIASYCTSLLFMVSFAKAYNGIDTERNFKKLLSSGLTEIILCATLSVPNIIMNIATDNGYLHTSMATNFSVLCTGLFTAAFIFSYFSAANSDNID